MNKQTIIRADIAIANLRDMYVHDHQKACISKELQATTAQAVKNRIGKKYIVSQFGNIIVTEIGYVTMALLAGNAIYRKDLLIIPGVDEKNQFGYLILRNNFPPYHSLSKTIDGAVAEIGIAHTRSAALVHYFGNRQSLKKSAAAAPWYRFSTMEDAMGAGLCQWGVLSFLQRYKLSFVMDYIGLPRFLVRLAGGYGDRVTASTIRRMEQNKKAQRSNTQFATSLTRKHS